MYKEIYEWLKASRIVISKKTLRLRLETHPDYPSLSAIEDTLEEMGIDAKIYKTTREKLSSVKSPVLVHLKIAKGTITTVRNPAKITIKDFEHVWSGIVIVAERNNDQENFDYFKLSKQEKRQELFGRLTVLFTGSLLACVFLSSRTTILFLALLSDIMGVCFALLIVQKEFGVSNKISEKLCSISSKFRCDDVLRSKGAKLAEWISWSDIGLAYFLSLSAFLSWTAFASNDLGCYYFISTSALIIVPYSLYYQWRVLGKWCLLCVGVSVALLANFLACFLYLPGFTFSGSVGQLAGFALMSIVFLFGWLLLKSVLVKNQYLSLMEIKNLRLKRNPAVFNDLLMKQDATSLYLPHEKDLISFGNSEAPHKILMVCNPYCVPCRKAHRFLENMFDANPRNYFISIRFSLPSPDERHQNVVAAKEIAKVVAEKKNSFVATRDWFSLFDLEEFKKLHRPNDIDVSAIIDQQVQWTRQTKISATPTFFLNGRKLPEPYAWEDMIEILRLEGKE